MKEIFEHADDLHVRARYIYKKSADTKAYLDSATTKTASLAVLKDMFEKGVMIIVDTSVEYRPVSFKVVSGTGTVTYVKTDGTTATTAVLATLTSTN